MCATLVQLSTGKVTDADVAALKQILALNAEAVERKAAATSKAAFIKDVQTKNKRLQELKTALAAAPDEAKKKEAEELTSSLRAVQVEYKSQAASYNDDIKKYQAAEASLKPLLAQYGFDAAKVCLFPTFGCNASHALSLQTSLRPDESADLQELVRLYASAPSAGAGAAGAAAPAPAAAASAAASPAAAAPSASAAAGAASLLAKYKLTEVKGSSGSMRPFDESDVRSEELPGLSWRCR